MYKVIPVRIIQAFICLMVTRGCLSMGELTPDNKLKEPVFVALEPGSASLEGKVYDKTVTQLHDISFFGHTRVDGIYREDDDSVSELDLVHIKTLIVTDHTYKSAKYPEKDLVVVKKVTPDGVVTTGLLAPAHIIVCGVEDKTGDRKRWFLEKIDKIVIERHPESSSAPKPTDEELSEAFKAEGEAEQEIAEPHIAEHKAESFAIVEKKASEDEKTVFQALNNIMAAVFEFFRTVFNAIKSLFW